MNGAGMPGDAPRAPGNHPAPVMRLGSEIARQFESWPDRDVAATEIAAHITKFWEPRMRQDLIGLVRQGEAGVPPLLAMAAGRLADLGDSSAPSP